MPLSISQFFRSCRFMETKKFKDIIPFNTAHSLSLLDLDNTVMEPNHGKKSHRAGSDSSFYARIKWYEKQGFKNPKERALDEWTALQYITCMRPVEQDTAPSIKAMQDRSYAVMGLTTRSAHLADRTLRVLKELNIDLSITAPLKKPFQIIRPDLVHYKNGVLFTSGTHKGEAFRSFLDSNQEIMLERISRIIYLNDKTSHLRELLEDLLIHLPKHIELIGIRYGSTDRRAKTLKFDLVHQQYELINRILHDPEFSEKASKLL